MNTVKIHSKFEKRKRKMTNSQQKNISKVYKRKKRGAKFKFFLYFKSYNVIKHFFRESNQTRRFM